MEKCCWKCGEEIGLYECKKCNTLSIKEKEIIKTWIDDPSEKKSEGWLPLIYNHYSDGRHWIKAECRFDGFVSLINAFNTPFPKDNDNGDMQEIHICHIDELIKELTLLKEVAKKHFGDDWK
jgi:hypothetical protein